MDFDTQWTKTVFIYCLDILNFPRKNLLIFVFYVYIQNTLEGIGLLFAIIHPRARHSRCWYL